MIAKSSGFTSESYIITGITGVGLIRNSGGQVFTFGVYPAMVRLLRIEYSGAVYRITSYGKAR